MNAPRLALVAPLAALGGCGYPSYYPDASRYALADTGHGPCHVIETEAVDLTIDNQLGGDADIYVIEEDCTSAWVVTVQPGNLYTLPTAAGREFVAHEGGLEHSRLTVPSGASAYTWTVQ